MNKKNTIFCDIDGTLFKYRKFESYKTSEAEVLDGAVEKIKEWRLQGHMVILTTARPQEMKEHTISELNKKNIEYDRLIMGIERGPRFLINDMDPHQIGDRAIGINLMRNSGLNSIYWDSWDNM
tara:strand:- start:68 stop:439 length:372 start_codon:yes stop_codon:yes gene_type:complete